MPKKKKTNYNDSRNKQLEGNDSKEVKDKEEKLTPEMIERNREWAKRHNRTNQYTSN